MGVYFGAGQRCLHVRPEPDTKPPLPPLKRGASMADAAAQLDEITALEMDSMHLRANEALRRFREHNGIPSDEERALAAAREAAEACGLAWHEDDPADVLSALVECVKAGRLF